MTEARFIIDSSGEAAQNPSFEIAVLHLTESAVYGLEVERIEAEKLAVWGSRAIQRADLRMAKGLLLEAAPEDRENIDDEGLRELPTGVFETIAAVSGDSGRMQRIRAEREQRKRETEAEKARREAVEAERSQQLAYRAANKRLKGRHSSGGKKR